MNKGYYLKARQIKKSWVAHAAPVVRELWDYLLREANPFDEKYNGFVLKRGELFRTYSDILDDLSWKVGYRTERYSENQMKHAMNLLTNQSMIHTTNKPRGKLIKVLNYEKYQDPKFYESTPESTHEYTHESTNESTKRFGPLIKNVKNKELRIKNNNTLSSDDDKTASHVQKISSKRKSSEKKTTQIPVAAQYGKSELNSLLSKLKELVGVDDFKESQKQQRFWLNNLFNLGKKIGEEYGKDEFGRRVQTILSDDFKAKNCNSLRYLYNEMKGFITKAPSSKPNVVKIR